MTDQEKGKLNKESESLGETVGDLVAEVAETIGSVLTAVAETVENVLEEVVGIETQSEVQNKTDDKVEDKSLKTEPDLKNDDAESQSATEIIDEKQSAETRLGYVQALPQADEAEEEKIIEEFDDKDAVEAAIAKARPSSSEEPEVKKDELVAETLPKLPQHDRARLQVQSPNRIFLYWSLADNPFETLYKAFGSRAANYTLVTKLVNLQSNAESYAPADLRGDWWYNVRSNSQYRVDLGFYAANRPFIRLFSSNVVSTPRVAPSLRGDTAEDWAVTRKQFEQVLEVSGYSHDSARAAFKTTASNESEQNLSTILVARQIASQDFVLTNDLDLSELRWLIIALAAGASYADLSEYLSDELVAWIKAVLIAKPDALSAENIRGVLESIFGADFVTAFAVEATLRSSAPTVFGASAIYFPEISFPKLRFPELLRSAEPNFSERDFAENLLSHSSAEFLRVSSFEFLD